MRRRRTFLIPAEAKTEGGRLLRELALKLSYGQIAHRLNCTEGAVRHWASEIREPDRRTRALMHAVFGWDPRVWEQEPRLDPYVESATLTNRIPPLPPTRPRPKKDERPAEAGRRIARGQPPIVKEAKRGRSEPR